MIAVYIAMTFILLVAVAIVGVVVVGMKGAGAHRVPDVARHLGHAARQMNGDAEPPRAFRDLVAQATSRS